MEGDQELRYQSGKSLGGHVRSRVVPNCTESDEIKILPNLKNWSSCKKEMSGYGLRENPRKTWRIVDSSASPSQQLGNYVCKQCGKGFQSLKALCGHMACHSEKEKGFKDDHSWTSENMKMEMMDYQSEAEVEVEAPPRRGRQRASVAAVRYKRVADKSSSSSVSDVEQEQEEVAMCLMMLSRDSGNRGSGISITESSDTNSVILETKSSSVDLGFCRRKGLTSVYDGDWDIGMKKTGEMKLNSGVLDDEIQEFENSDSGYFLNGSKKDESDVALDGFLTIDQIKNPKVGSSKGLIYKEIGLTSNSVKHKSRKRTMNDSSILEVTKTSQKKIRYESNTKKNTIARASNCNGERQIGQKKGKAHECPVCLRVFKSGQALGGHKRSHFLGGVSSERDNPVIEIEKEVSEFSELLDLNLPPPEED